MVIQTFEMNEELKQSIDQLQNQVGELRELIGELISDSKETSEKVDVVDEKVDDLQMTIKMVSEIELKQNEEVAKAKQRQMISNDVSDERAKLLNGLV